MQWWTDIRMRMAHARHSKRQLCREEGISYKTLEKILMHPEPPGYRRQALYPQPKLGPFVDRIAEILAADRALPKKQRHSAQRIFERLVEEGYEGGYTQVREKVAQLRRRQAEVFIPLRRDPGTAQVDVGEALAGVGGKLRKVYFFVMALPHSDAIFVQCFERARTEMFWEFHRRAFEYFGGVARWITYDNDSVLVSSVIGTRARRLTRGFLQLQSHYLFAEHFCAVRRPNEKGVVEPMVKYARGKWFVPVPQVRDFEQLNTQLEQSCRRDLSRTLRGQKASKAVLLAEDQAALLPLPAGRFDACTTAKTVATGQSLVRFDTNDYSVPECYAHHELLVKGYFDRVEIVCAGKLITGHDRRWGREEKVLNPLHYVTLLERKPGALDWGLPFADWPLPECFAVLRARLEQQYGDDGTRQFIGMLKLLNDHPPLQVARAIERALACNALIRDAIAQFLIPQQEWRHTTFRLDGREQLRAVKVEATDVSAYADLVSGGGC